MKNFFISGLMLFVLFSVATAQTFSLSPRTYVATPPCSGVSVYQIDLTNNGSSALSLSYALIENTLPDTGCWTQSYCDCNLCHPDNYIPDNDLCYTSVGAGSTTAIMVFDVKNTKGHIGWGHIQYLIYETGNASNSDTLTFEVTGCSNGVFCATGINENPLEHMNIFPSLTNDKININGNGNFNHIESLVIYDCIGKKVHSEKNIELSENKKSVDVSKLQSGLYILQISEGGFISTKNFVKSN